jgi:hypothetical protein
MSFLGKCAGWQNEIKLSLFHHKISIQPKKIQNLLPREHGKVKKTISHYCPFKGVLRNKLIKFGAMLVQCFAAPGTRVSTILFFQNKKIRRCGIIEKKRWKLQVSLLHFPHPLFTVFHLLKGLHCNMCRILSVGLQRKKNPRVFQYGAVYSQHLS